MTPEAIIAAATRLGATVLRAPGADVIVITHDEPAENDLIRIHDCARIAKTSVRVVKDDIRAGEIAAFGKQRDRSVRYADLMAWIETRRVKPVVGPDDADVEKWMRRREKNGGAVAPISKKSRSVSSKETSTKSMQRRGRGRA
jgi:hypothetical protein